MTITHLFCLLACAGHLVLWRCDRNLTYLAGGRFDFRCLQDNDRLSAVLGGTPLKQPMGATMAGVFALTAAFSGYLALCQWMEQFSKLWAGLMLAGCVLFFLPGMAHHVFCGALEWFYLWLDRTEEAREVVVFFSKAPLPPYSSDIWVCWSLCCLCSWPWPAVPPACPAEPVCAARCPCFYCCPPCALWVR